VNVVQRPRVAVVGCGDVARRRYLPTLASLAGSVELVACCDADARRARDAAAGPGVRAARNASDVARSERLDGVLNLTPPHAHADVTAECLEAGLHVFTEKPLAIELGAARELVARAAAASKLLLCAPAVMATARFRWLSALVASGRLGRITLAAGQLANLGPAAWPAYTGDVGAYDRAGVGPLIDQGVYVLHAMVGMLGPARRVHAFAASPRRLAEIADHWLVQLDFAEGVLGQLLSSYAVPASRAPLLELHAERGSISISEAPPLTDAGPVDLHLDGSWIADARPPVTPRAGDSMIGVGVAHFVGCLSGRETPLLTADRALHVLEIARTAELSAASGAALPLQTSFPWP
jgi:predicted dehydrogenase